MKNKRRRRHSAADKVRILRLHLLEGKPVSELCEAEGILDLFFDLFRDLKDSRAPRGEILRTLARKLRSLYVPSLYRCEHSKDGTIRSWRV